MSNLIEQLHQDHINMFRLLDAIEIELDRLTANEVPDLKVLEHSMRYMINYPDVTHHPREDALFERLRARDPATAPLVDEVIGEHQNLIRRGREFYEMICAAENFDVVERDAFITAGTEYVHLMRAHMNTEEGSLIKEAAAQLTADDLAAASAEVESKRDPLFGEWVDEEYQMLYEYVINLAEPAQHQA